MAVLNVKNFPDDLARRLRRRARAEHRSVAAEVTHLLSRALEEPTHSLLELRGLGREFWRGTDAAAHVAAERDSWE